jgi:uncharacterized protein (DUF2249 family)/hemerythrin-like domain-containing protein
MADAAPEVGPHGREGDAVALTEVEALEAMLAHHRTLDEGVRSRALALGQAAASGDPYDSATAELVAYLAEEVLPHALGEEHTIYRTAKSLPELAATVGEMIGEHRRLAAMIDDLGEAMDGPAAVSQAEQIATLFTAHVAKENDILLPVLLADDDIDLAELLEQMHDLTEEAQKESSLLEDFTTSDTEAALLSREEEFELDVRSLAHGQRHESIFAAYDALASGETFVLVNDHDPKPLRYQFETQYQGAFSWDYFEAGPRDWRVRIGKLAV